jgi:magnesium transporter
MITYLFRSIKDVDLKTLATPRNGVWVHVVAPTKEDIKILVEQFHLDEDMLEDAQDYFEVPRLERLMGLTYFFTRYPYRDDRQGSDTAPLLIVVGDSFVLTLGLREISPFQPLLEGTIPVVTTQKTKLFIQLMTALTTSFGIELVRLRKAVHKDRVKIRQIGTKEIERLVQYESRLNDIVGTLIPTNAWLQQVTKNNSMQFFSEDVEEMQDLIIDNSQVVDSAKSVLKTIQNIRSGFEAIMSARLNNALRILTVLTILLTVPLVVASLYGMNVTLPLQENNLAFIFIIVFNILAISLLVSFFKKKQWF